MAIPFISYAPVRDRLSIDTTTGTLVNDSINRLTSALGSLGWASEGIKASTDIFVFVCPTFSEDPVPRFAPFDNILFLEGGTYAFYDPRIDPVPTGSGIIPIEKQRTALASMAKLAEAITAFSSYVAIIVDVQHLHLEAKAPGTGANDLPCVGNGSLSMGYPAKGGGNRLHSAAANGNTSFSIDVIEGEFGNLVVTTRLAGNERTYPFGRIRYDALANPYQLAIYPPDDPADYRAYNDVYQDNTGLFVCAPWVPPQHSLAYCAFAIFGTAGMRRTTSTTSAVAIALNGFYYSGDWRVGDSGYALNMLRVPGDPLLDPKGRSILQEALIALSPKHDGPGDAGSTVVVGRIWDAFAESRWNPRGAETFLDDHRWVLLMSDEGATVAGSDFGGRTPSNLWIACD